MKDQKTQNVNVNKRTFQGEVVSIAGEKTVTVLVNTTKMHAKYQKQYKSSKKYAVHDEHGKAKVGDVVMFAECRPISKRKHWTLKQVVA